MADRRTARADIKAEKAREKAMRPWYKKKRFIIPLVLVVLIVLAAVASGGGDDKPGGSTATPAGDSADGGGDAGGGEVVLFPGRLDAQGEDQERNIGEEARLSGYTAVVNSAEFVQTVSDFEDAGYVKINVTVTNRDDAAQPYNLFDWRIQTPGGTVQDAGFVSAATLGSGDLVSGGTVTGDIYFEVGAETGDFFVVYKPDPFDAARGVWKVTV